MDGWHFLRKDYRLQFPPYTLVAPGMRLDLPIESRRRSLRASKKALDALLYASGPIACRVRLSGKMIEDINIVIAAECTYATECTYLQMVDATNVLHEFACWCAENALTQERASGREPDPLCWKAIEAKRAWLQGKMSNEDLDAAKEAVQEITKYVDLKAACGINLEEIEAVVYEAASATVAAADRRMVQAIARRASGAAVWEAAKAAEIMTGGAPWDAARCESGQTAWVTTKKKQNEKLEEMLFSLFSSVSK